MTSIISTILALAVVIAHASIAGLAILYLLQSISSYAESVEQIISQVSRRRAYLMGFIVVLIATVGSLFYSEIADYDPCKLCWFQRVLMYPQVIILSMAWWLDDNSAWLYSLVLSSLGFMVAMYHYGLQLWPSQVVNCSVVGQATSCSGTYLMQLGYITIPLMAATAFLLIVLFMMQRKRLRQFFIL
jgi:disulfide bond formation protein DsbB